jgi:predicted NAD-dependent protein-ADP-ribosyltransferase YbiA (DUF1768 family)
VGAWQKWVANPGGQPSREVRYYKFTISEHAENLRKLLMQTGDRELVEASLLDRTWGLGLRRGMQR